MTLRVKFQVSNCVTWISTIHVHGNAQFLGESDLEYFCSIVVTLTIMSGVMNPVFKKCIYFPSAKVNHKNYAENITLIEQFEH